MTETLIIISLFQALGMWAAYRLGRKAGFYQAGQLHGMTFQKAFTDMSFDLMVDAYRFAKDGSLPSSPDAKAVMEKIRRKAEGLPCNCNACLTEGYSHENI